MKNREIAKGTEFCHVDHNWYTKFKYKRSTLASGCYAAGGQGQ